MLRLLIYVTLTAVFAVFAVVDSAMNSADILFYVFALVTLRAMYVKVVTR